MQRQLTKEINMYTRATYLFEAGNHVQAVCFYIHYDGYESGAAGYFAAMLSKGLTRGGWAGSFVRANELAEFTGSHASHGDTEYRYTVSVFDGHLQLRVDSRVSWSSEEWRCTYVGRLVAFVNKHQSVRFVSIGGGDAASVAGYLDRIGGKLAQAQHHFRQGWTGNAASLVSEARLLARVSPEDVGADTVASLEAMEREITAKFATA
jgi:hypothetical protein